MIVIPRVFLFTMHLHVKTKQLVFVWNDLFVNMLYYLNLRQLISEIFDLGYFFNESG